MCDPVTTSLMVASAGASYAGNRKSQKAMEGAVAAESQRQRKFREQQSGILDVSTKNRSAARTKEEMALDAAKANTEANEALAANSADKTDQPTAVAPSAASSQNVTDSYSREDARAGARSRDEIGRKSALNAFNNVMSAQAINNTKYAQDSAVLANMSQGSLSVMPYEVQAASKAGDGLKTLSQVLSLASIYSGYQAGIGKPLGPASWSEVFNPQVAATTGAAAAPASMTPSLPTQNQVLASSAGAPLNPSAGNTYVPGLGAPSPLNTMYTNYPATGMGPPSFDAAAATRGGFVNQNGAYIGGTKAINNALTNPYKHLRPIR
jgi:hypothetical protein